MSRRGSRVRFSALALFAAVLFAAALCRPAPASAELDEFVWNPPGELEAGQNGLEDWTDYVPGMRFPIESGPAYANSQVYGAGGLYGPPGVGGTCDPSNYTMPWSDNYCEPRAHAMPLCPSGTGHQGQDIRPASCEKGIHAVVSADAGTVTHIGSYSVSIVSEDGTRHRYLHMDMANLAVSLHQSVSRGQRIGFVSNDFGGTPTSIHLHYDIQQVLEGFAQPVYVSPYMALVNSYLRLLGEPCELIPAEGAILDDRSPCLRLHGPAQYWRDITDERAHGGSLRWTRAFDGVNPSNWAEWELSFEEEGVYALSLHSLPEYGSSAQLPILIRHAEGEALFTIDLSEAGEGFFPLGEYRFLEGTNGSVAILDNTGEAGALDRRIPIDALKLSRVHDEDRDDDLDDEEPPVSDEEFGEEDWLIGEAWSQSASEEWRESSGGCSTMSTRALSPMLLLLALWALLRPSRKRAYDETR